MPLNTGFRHLDPSSPKLYTSKVTYGFEAETVCLICNVKNGYVMETPTIKSLRWIRGQHIETLKPFFVNIKPLRLAST
jgi:hypothetical protein